MNGANCNLRGRRPNLTPRRVVPSLGPHPNLTTVIWTHNYLSDAQLRCRFKHIPAQSATSELASVRAVSRGSVAHGDAALKAASLLRAGGAAREALGAAREAAEAFTTSRGSADRSTLTVRQGTGRGAVERAVAHAGGALEHSRAAVARCALHTALTPCMAGQRCCVIRWTRLLKMVLPLRGDPCPAAPGRPDCLTPNHCFPARHSSPQALRSVAHCHEDLGAHGLALGLLQQQVGQGRGSAGVAMVDRGGVEWHLGPPRSPPAGALPW